MQEIKKAKQERSALGSRWASGRTKGEGEMSKPVNCDNKIIQAALRRAVAKYAACVFAPTDLVEVRRLPSGKRSWWRASQLADAALSLYYENRRGQNIHIGANARRHWGESKSNGIACARCVFADFDEMDVETAQQRWIQVGLPSPTLTLASGHGIHAFWRLKEPMQDLVAWSWVQKQLIRLLRSDQAIHDPARLMRLPGYANLKKPKAICRVIEADPSRRYDWVLLRTKWFTPNNPSAMKRSVLKKNRPPYRMNMTRDNQKIMTIADKVTARWKGAGKGQRNNKAFCYAAYLVRDLALPRNKALFFLQQWNQSNQPPLPVWELQQAIQNAFTYGKHPVGD